MKDFNSIISDYTALVDAQLEAILPAASGPAEQLFSAMRYSTFNGGKRVRPALCFAAAEAVASGDSNTAKVAAAVEMIHAYSLIHDDLPAMDNDDLRRGQPTVHVKWDDATAVLCGDALQTLAFELVSDPACHDDPFVCSTLALTLARASGAAGMVYGQALDIAAESAATPLNIDEITELQNGKTGALITWSATAGAILAKADTQALKTYGDSLGLAFQIADDILDVTSDAATLGKAAQKDAEAGKATFVSLLGLDGAKLRAETLVESACDALSVYGSDADHLRSVARFVVERRS